MNDFDLSAVVEELCDAWFGDDENAPVEEADVCELFQQATNEELEACLKHIDADYRAAAVAAVGSLQRTELLKFVYPLLEDECDWAWELAHWCVQALDRQGYHFWRLWQAVGRYSETHAHEPYQSWLL